MSGEQGTILVAGATGHAGRRRRAAPPRRRLRRARHHARPRRRRRRSRSATPASSSCAADLTDRASVDGLFDGVTGVFSVATPFEAGLDAEVAQGKTLGDAAKAAGVSHYVYSSVGGADRDSKVPHFESKWAIENHLRALGLPLTVVRPVYFFENFGGWALQPSGARLHDGDAALAGPAAAGGRRGRHRRLRGHGVRRPRGVDRPGVRAGRRRAHAAGVRRRHRGRARRRVEYVQAPWEALREQNEDLYRMYDFFEREGYAADIAALRAEYPGLQVVRRLAGRGRSRRAGQGRLSVETSSGGGRPRRPPRASAERQSTGAGAGSVKKKVAPLSTSASAQMRPPCRRTRR